MTRVWVPSTERARLSSAKPQELIEVRNRDQEVRHVPAGAFGDRQPDDWDEVDQSVALRDPGTTYKRWGWGLAVTGLVGGIVAGFTTIDLNLNEDDNGCVFGPNENCGGSSKPSEGAKDNTPAVVIGSIAGAVGLVGITLLSIGYYRDDALFVDGPVVFLAPTLDGGSLTVRF